MLADSASKRSCAAIPPLCTPLLLCLSAIFFLFAPAVLLTAQTTSSATSVPLLLPSAIALDGSGNLYIAEMANHVIRRVDPSGQLTIVAGTGTQGFSGDGSPATSSTLDSPQGLAVVSSGLLYIADTNNHRIRLLNLATGVLTTIAGTGVAGYSGDGGSALSAQLFHPTALAADSSGDLYLADTGNHRIRRIDAVSGVISTVAGNGSQGSSSSSLPATQSAIDSPMGLALDPAGNLFLADSHNHRILRVDATSGIMTTVAGTGSAGFSGDGAPASSASLALPQGITIDSTGNLLFADAENHRIRRIDGSTGAITTVAGSGVQGFSGDGAPAISATLDSPRSTAISSQAAPLFSDTHNGRVREVEASNIVTIAGLGAMTPVVLNLTVPPTISYGAGQLTATLATAAPATGTITFFATQGATTSTLGVVPVQAGTAALSLSTLAAGAYTVTATYSGDQSHAPAQSTPQTLTISPAATVTTMSNLIATAGSGSSTPISVQVASTAGTPSGTVTLIDSNLPIATNPVSGGFAIFNISTLATGIHNLSAAYNGSTNYSPSISSPQQVTIGTGPAADFTFASSGDSTQTTNPGVPATFTFAAQPSPTLSSPITLAVSGQPSFATVSFSPSYIPPGSPQSAVTLTITTPSNAQLAASQNPRRHPTSIIWVGLLFPIWLINRRKRTRQLLCASLTALFFIMGCGDRTNSASITTPLSKSYAMTISGTATSPTGATLVHTVNVTLVLQAAN